MLALANPGMRTAAERRGQYVAPSGPRLRGRIAFIYRAVPFMVSPWVTSQYTLYPHILTLPVQ